MAPVSLRALDRSEQAALVAAREAWADAGFTGRSEDNDLDPVRVAVVFGTGIGGVTSLLGQYDIYLEKGPGRVSPLMIPMNMPNGPAAMESSSWSITETVCRAGMPIYPDFMLCRAKKVKVSRGASEKNRM